MGSAGPPPPPPVRLCSWIFVSKRNVSILIIIMTIVRNIFTNGMIFVSMAAILFWRPFWISGQNCNGLLIKLSLVYKNLPLYQFSPLFLKMNNRHVLLHQSAPLVTRHWNWMNSYWMFWIGCLRRARSELARWAVSAISKNDLSWFNRVLSFLTQEKSCVFQIFLLRSIKTYLCPNIINFDAVDFSERRPQEVISFFWRSVYLNIISILVRYWIHVN